MMLGGASASNLVWFVVEAEIPGGEATSLGGGTLSESFRFKSLFVGVKIEIPVGGCIVGFGDGLLFLAESFRLISV